MQYALSSWVVWVIVEAVSLTFVRVSVSVHPLSSQASSSSPTLQADRQDSSEWLFTKPSSLLQEFGLQMVTVWARDHGYRVYQAVHFARAARGTAPGRERERTADCALSLWKAPAVLRLTRPLDSPY
jgi:hypothetical protein